MNQKLTALLSPRFGLYFLCLLLFAGASAITKNYYLAVAEAVAAVLLFLGYHLSGARRRRETEKYLRRLAGNVGLAAKDTMLNCPMPVVMFQPDTGDVVWSNDRFLSVIGKEEHLFDTKLSSAVPGFDTRWLLEGKLECPDEVELGQRRFRVYGHIFHADDHNNQYSLLATTYWMDITSLAETRDTYLDTRPVMAILLLDNYEDTLKGLDEADRARFFSDINNELAAWTEGTNGLLRRLERDRYLFIFEEQHLQGYINEKFSLLEKVRTIQTPAGQPVTISIGLGVDGDNFTQLYQYASLALETALSRGGDQAVLKNRFTFEFFGGRNRETEKRTKVKSRVMANTLSELASDSSCIMVMGHKFPDMDAVGAAAGVCAIARKRGVPAYIVLDNGPTPADDLIRRLRQLPEYAGVFLSEQDALLKANSGTLLVVVDTNRPEQVQSRALLESCNKVAVIDHHRRAATYIDGVALNFHEPYASSAAELVTELIGYIMDPSDLLKGEAEALMAGLMLDTKNFTTRTGGRTFESAAFLRRSGADTGEVKKFFQNNLQETLARYSVIRHVEMYHDTVAVAAVDHPVERVAAAQAADELLNVAGIDASFVLCPNGEQVIISARSGGKVNVQVVLEPLGGGGNAAVAGAQIPGQTVSQVTHALLASIDSYFADEGKAD